MPGYCWSTHSVICGLVINATLFVLSQVSEDLVHAMHKEFYNSLERLWQKYQPTYEPYRDVKLVMAY
jgi:hypothetical protein